MDQTVSTNHVSYMVYKHEKRCKLLHRIPIRYIVLFMCFFYLCNSIVIRDLLLATADVWANTTDTITMTNSGPCNFTKDFFEHVVIPQPRAIIHYITEKKYDQMNKMYFLGHITTQMVGGYIVDKRGGRKILMIYGLLTFLLVAIGPFVIQISVGYAVIISVWRFILGVVTGVLYPSIMGVIAQWTPKHRRSTVIALMNSTLGIGSILSRTVCRYLILVTGYWQTAFYTWAILVGCCLIMWYYLRFSSPNTHPHISSQEKHFLYQDLGKSTLPFNKRKIPWLKIFTSIPFWASFVNHMGKGWMFFSMYFYSVAFFATVLRISIPSHILWGQNMIFIVVTISMISSGILCDFLVVKDIMDITTTRKIFSNFGAIGVGAYLVTMSLVGCNQMLGYVLFLVMGFFYGLYEVGVNANDIDLSPNYAGTLKGISTSAEYLVIFAIPALLNKMTKDQTVSGWRSMFLVILLEVMLSNIVFSVAGKAKEQDFNHSQIKSN